MKASILTKETILDYAIEDRNFPKFNIGDTVEISQVVKDGEKERIQLFRGSVISDHNKGIASTFTVRKIGANGIGVERIFPYYSQNVKAIVIIKKGKVRRAKLNYIRKRVGKSARIKEKIITKKQQATLNAKKQVNTPKVAPKVAPKVVSKEKTDNEKKSN